MRAKVVTVICAGWGEPGGQWTEWGWRNEEGQRQSVAHCRQCPAEVVRHRWIAIQWYNTALQ